MVRLEGVKAGVTLITELRSPLSTKATAEATLAVLWWQSSSSHQTIAMESSLLHV